MEQLDASRVAAIIRSVLAAKHSIAVAMAGRGLYHRAGWRIGQRLEITPAGFVVLLAPVRHVCNGNLQPELRLDLAVRLVVR